MWNKFLDRMLKLWIAIPNSLKSGVVHLILIVFFFIYLVNGVEFVIEFFNGSSSLKPLILSSLWFWHLSFSGVLKM